MVKCILLKSWFILNFRIGPTSTKNRLKSSTRTSCLIYCFIAFLMTLTVRTVDIIFWQSDNWTWLCKVVRLLCWHVRCYAYLPYNGVDLSEFFRFIRCYVNLSDYFVIICMSLTGQEHSSKIIIQEMNRWQVNIEKNYVLLLIEFYYRLSSLYITNQSLDNSF